MGLAERLKLAKLFVVTPRLLADRVFAAADFMELKDPKLGRKEALARLQSMRLRAMHHDTIVVVLDDLGLATEHMADALLLEDDNPLTAAEAHKDLHEWALVGRIVIGPEQIDAALADDNVDFLFVRPGLDFIKYAAKQAPQTDPASKPWFAAGGITRRTLPIVLEAGAKRVGVGRAITTSEDPVAEAEWFADMITEAWTSDPAMEKVRLAAFGLKPGFTPPGEEDAGAPLKFPKGGASEL